MTGVLPDLVTDLVDANHILADRQILDGFGHVSVRLDRQDDTFLLSRSLAPSQIEPEDIHVFDADSEIISGQVPTYVERYIHGEIYRLRPDVNAIVHSHVPSILPFGIVGLQLEPACHMCGFLAAGAPMFDIRDHAGDATDLLIRTRALGQALARCLNSASVVIMRGHGMTVVGRDVREATYNAVYTELNARVQSAALSLGTPNYLTHAEALAAQAVTEHVISRPWDLWRNESRARRNRRAYPST